MHYQLYAVRSAIPDAEFHLTQVPVVFKPLATETELNFILQRQPRFTKSPTIK